VTKIVIGGIGSVLLGDDGVGPHVIRLLEASCCFDDSVSVVDLGTPGLDLIAHLSGVDAVILIDSVNNGAIPGTITLYRRDDILGAGPAPVRMDPHSPALSESLLIADFTGEGAREVLLIGITGQQYDAGTRLSASAREGAGRAVNAVLAELDRLGAHYSHREATGTPAAWWEPLEAPSRQLI
jgi:hydrogenase maturation protease